MSPVTALAPGASLGVRRRLLSVLESALGGPGTIVSRLPAQTSSEPVLLLDADATEDEVATLWGMRSSRHVVAASGAWLVRDNGSDLRWEDPIRSPRESRMSVDLPLPGPFVGPASSLGGLADSDQWTSVRMWLSLATAWRRDGVVCLSARLRESALAAEVLPEMSDLEKLPRPRSNWRLANRVILPDAESRNADPSLKADASQLAIVGAQRSGTTWASNLFGSLEGFETVPERRTFDVLIEGFPACVHPPVVPVWQATFLTCCSSLLLGLAAKTQVVALVRDPIQIVRSMLFHWKHLRNVAALASRLAGTASPRQPLDQALLVISTAWKNLSHLMEVVPDRVVFVDYDSLCADPATVVAGAARSLGWDGDHSLAGVAVRRSELPRLTMAECHKIDQHLREPFLLLSNHAQTQPG